jgi:diaminopimelate epimerase
MKVGLILLPARMRYIVNMASEIFSDDVRYLSFTKVEAIGNNLILVDALLLPDMNWPLLAKRMCSHHFGIGADGLLVLLPASRGDIRMRMFNPDGTEDACGNGLRCSAAYARITGLSASNHIVFETNDGLHVADVLGVDDKLAMVKVNMGRPCFCPSDLPAKFGDDRLMDYPLQIDGQEYRINCVKIGTPHAVIFAPKEFFWDEIPSVSPLIEVHPAFPERTNITWCAVESPNSLYVRTWERAVGPTLGCGTGACSALIAAKLRGLAGSNAKVTSPGGFLDIQWPDEGEVIMSGPARLVFKARWPLTGDERNQ